MVLALNMMDEIKNNQSSVDVLGIARELEIPVVPISATKKEGIDDLVLATTNAVKNNIRPANIDWCEGAIHRTLHGIIYLIEDHAIAHKVSPRFAATKLIEGDAVMLKSLDLTQNEIETIEHMVQQMEDESGLERYAAVATMRYSYIDKLVSKYVVKPKETIERVRLAQL